LLLTVCAFFLLFVYHNRLSLTNRFTVIHIWKLLSFFRRL